MPVTAQPESMTVKLESITSTPRVIPLSQLESLDHLQPLLTRIQRVYELPLPELENTRLDLRPVGISRAFRLVDCRRYVEEQVLAVYELPDIPDDVKYSTISYPWIGNNGKSWGYSVLGKTFEVGSVSDQSIGDPISTDVLRLACSIALKDRMDFLWLDRLCIIQTDAVDKTWHLNRMTAIFRRCSLCIIVPSGLQRWASRDLPMLWATRMWTLMETILAPQVCVLLKERQELQDLLWTYASSEFEGMDGHRRASHELMLLDVLAAKDQRTSPNDEQRYQYYIYVWRCALFRSAFHIEDILISALGLLDIPLTVEEGYSLETVLPAFTERFVALGCADPRVVAFRDAVILSGKRISPQWEQLVDYIMPRVEDLLPQELEPPVLCVPHVTTDFKCPPDGLVVIKAYEVALSELHSKKLDISPVSTPCTFRLMDCKRFLEDHVLTIYETPGIPTTAYVAISYPWVGVPCNRFRPVVSETFTVIQSKSPGLPGDPINTDVLRLACILSLRSGINLLWLDRLCIRQRDSVDKSWQITRMCDVYRACKLCIIVPGGLQRLAGLDEATPWITRMWTLQEAIVPVETTVLYTSVSSYEDRQGTPILPGEAARQCDLDEVLVAREETVDYRRRFFGYDSDRLLLVEALSRKGFTYGYDSEYRKHISTWSSAIIRVADRPQDLLLSVMGLFNITLPENAHRSSDNIVSAFVEEFRAHGLADRRVVAFREAFDKVEERVATQWGDLLDSLERSLPLFNDRLPLSSGDIFPSDKAGPPVGHDASGRALYICSAPLTIKYDATNWQERSVHPCEVAVSADGSFTCVVTYKYEEKTHDGPFELLPFDEERMAWVPAKLGNLPYHWKPVIGGYEVHRFDEDQGPYTTLYHGKAIITDDSGATEEALGRTAPHLFGCLVGRKGKQIKVEDNYMLLCWREDIERDTNVERIEVGPNAEFPFNLAGPPVTTDDAGHPVYMGLAFVEGKKRCLVPCKIIPSLPQSARCLIPFDGVEIVHTGPYSVVRFDPDAMEWVTAQYNSIPVDQEVVEGGYDFDDDTGKQVHLLHALATIQNDSGKDIQIPGKRRVTNMHYKPVCTVGYNGKELKAEDNYKVLCWKMGARAAAEREGRAFAWSY